MKITGFIDEIDKGFEKELEIAKNLKMNYVELRSINQKNIADITIHEAIHIKKILDKKNIKVSSLASPIGKIRIADENLKEHFEKFKHLIKLCKIFQTRFIRIFSFFMEREEKEKYEKKVIEELSKYLQYIENKNITLLHENEKNIFGDDISSCLKLVTTLNHPQFKLIYDSANFVQVGENPLKALETLEPYIKYYHLKDAHFYSPNNILIGDGDGQIKEILKRLQEKNYDGFLSLEPHLTNFSTLQSLEIESIENRDGQLKDGEEAFRKSYQRLQDILNRDF